MLFIFFLIVSLCFWFSLVGFFPCSRPHVSPGGPSGAGPWPRSERRDDVVFSLRNAALPSNGRLRCGRTSECRFGKARLVPLWAALGQREQRSSTAPGALRSLRRHNKEPRHCFTVNFLIPCCTFFFSVEVSNDRASIGTCNYHRPGKKEQQKKGQKRCGKWRAAGSDGEPPQGPAPRVADVPRRAGPSPGCGTLIAGR